MIEQEDRQDITQSIIQKHEEKHHDYIQELPTVYSADYLQELLKIPALNRTICVAGHLSHGKTLLMDMLVQETHIKNWDLEKNYRWMDTRVDEQEREMSIKASPITLLLPDFKQKNYAFNIIDTPGHPNFIAEFVAALRVSDGVVLVVDAIEGVMMNT